MSARKAFSRRLSSEARDFMVPMTRGEAGRGAWICILRGLRPRCLGWLLPAFFLRPRRGVGFIAGSLPGARFPENARRRKDELMYVFSPFTIEWARAKAGGNVKKSKRQEVQKKGAGACTSRRRRLVVLGGEGHGCASLSHGTPPSPMLGTYGAPGTGPFLTRRAGDGPRCRRRFHLTQIVGLGSFFDRPKIVQPYCTNGDRPCRWWQYCPTRWCGPHRGVEGPAPGLTPGVSGRWKGVRRHSTPGSSRGGARM